MQSLCHDAREAVPCKALNFNAQFGSFLLIHEGSRRAAEKVKSPLHLAVKSGPPNVGELDTVPCGQFAEPGEPSDVLGPGCRLPQRGGAVLAGRHVRRDPPGAPRPIRSSSVRAPARRPRTWGSSPGGDKGTYHQIPEREPWARRTPISSFSLTFRNVLTGRVRFTGHAAARARPGPSSASACRARRWPVSMTVIAAPSARCRGAPGHATPTAAECPR